MRAVARISTSPIRNFRLHHPEEVWLGPEGVVANRRFFLVGGEGERLRSSKTSWPAVLEARYDEDAENLTIRLPDGREASGSAVADGEVRTYVIAEREQRVRVVRGPWEELLAERAGHEVRVVRCEREGAAMVEPVTLVSDGSLARLARELGVGSLDPRRFRMLFQLDGCEEHEEDGWEGMRVRLGEAVVRIGEPVIRCQVTTRNPDSGESDLDVLRALKSYRGQRESDGALLFGMYARVEQPGAVRIGDPVEPLGA